VRIGVGLGLAAGGAEFGPEQSGALDAGRGPGRPSATLASSSTETPSAVLAGPRQAVYFWGR